MCMLLIGENWTSQVPASPQDRECSKNPLNKFLPFGLLNSHTLGIFRFFNRHEIFVIVKKAWHLVYKHVLLDNPKREVLLLEMLQRKMLPGVGL